MLRAEELRIGNYVNYKYFNPDPKNSGFCFEKVIIVGVLKSDLYFKHINGRHINRIKELYPIELTEEILTKTAFYCPDSECFIVKNCTLRLYDYYEDGFMCVIFGNESHFIKYLHQLQNLIYALTGTELEVNL